MHFGVKGMKWGVRRYQRKDGSLTNAGKKYKVSVLQGLQETKTSKQLSKAIKNKQR